MKKMKRILSLVLALAMVMAMGITSFAAENSTATLIVKEYGVEKFNESVTLTDGMTLYNAINLYADDLDPDWDPVEDYYTPGVYHQALVSMRNLGTVPATPSNVNVIEWSTTNPGYGLVSESTDAEGKPVYTYIYCGYDWTYTVNGVAYNNYADACVLEAGDKVVFDYKLQITDPFTTSYKL